MIEPVWIVGFSGHRPGNGPGRSVEEINRCHDSLRSVLCQLQDKAKAQEGRIELLTGVAIGADLLVAGIAEELGIVVHVILPLPEAMFLEDFSEEEVEDHSRAQRLISAAKNRENGATLRTVYGENTRPECYHEAGIQMLEASDLLLTVWNGDVGAGLGGTAEVVEQAERIGLPVIQVNPATKGQVTHRSPIEDWLKADTILQELDKLVISENNLFEEHVFEEKLKLADLSINKASERIFWLMDNAATRMGSKFRGGLVQAIMLHFIAAMIAATNAAMLPIFKIKGHNTNGQSTNAHSNELIEYIPKILTAIELALVTWALLIMLACARRHLSRGWRESRFGTELIRSLLASADFLDPLKPLILHHAQEWRRFAVSLALITFKDSQLNLSDDEKKNKYLKGRINSQRDQYFKKEHEPARKSAKVLGVIGLLSSWLAPIFILTALLIKLNHKTFEIFPDWIEALFASWFPIAIPLLAGAATSLILAKDAARRTERYRHMAKRLDMIARAFPGFKTHLAAKNAVSVTEEILLDELVEWYAVAKNTGH